MSVCRSCDAPVLWVRMQSGSSMPVNPEPHPTGNVEVFPPGPGARRGRVRSAASLLGDEPAPEGTTLHLSHFASCPNAAQHRRKATK